MTNKVEGNSHSLVKNGQGRRCPLLVPLLYAQLLGV